MTSKKEELTRAKILDFTPRKEAWTEYELEDGTIVRMKVELIGAYLLVNEKGKPILKCGKPQYHFEQRISMKVIPKGRITFIRIGKKPPKGLYA